MYNAYTFWIIPQPFSFPEAKYIWMPYFHLCLIVLDMVICCSFIVLSFSTLPMLTSHSKMLHTSNSAVRRKHQYPRFFDDARSPRSQWKLEDNFAFTFNKSLKRAQTNSAAACSCQVSPLLHIICFFHRCRDLECLHVNSSLYVVDYIVTERG